jgi:hypothetical protein
VFNFCVATTFLPINVIVHTICNHPVINHMPITYSRFHQLLHFSDENYVLPITIVSVVISLRHS